MGLRSQEIATLRWEYIKLDDGYTYVLDSKRHQLYPLPIDWRVAKVLPRHMDQTEDSAKGWVIKRNPGPVRRSAIGKPVSSVTLENIIKHYARQADIPNWAKYNPRLLRCYFAAIWVQERRDIKVLQTLMRHKHLAQTLHYVGRILFWEDIQVEFDRIQTGPFERRLKKLSVSEMLERPVVQQCLKCPGRFVCKYIDRAVEAEWAKGCRFYPKIVEELLALKVLEDPR